MIARAWAIVVLLALAVAANLCVVDEAHAQAQQCINKAAGCDQGTAYAACMSELKNYISVRESSGEVFRNVQCTVSSPTSFDSRFENRLNSGGWSPGLYRTYTWSGNTCAARLDGDAGMINGTLYSGGVCDRGCKVQPNFNGGSDFSIRENGNPNAISVKSGTWKASGEMCSVDSTQPKPEKKDEYCHTTSSGHKVCKSKDQTCVSTASGFRTCASDTANTTGHTATNNQRTEAASIGAPNSQPNPPTNRPGENWQPSSGGGGGVTNNGTGVTNNYNTYNNQGTPNGNQPTPGDGSGPGQGGSNGNGSGNSGGEGEGSSDSAGDSGNCEAPPSCTGDTLKCLQLTYTWKVQCNTKGAEISGGDGCGENDMPVCAGTTCKAETYASLLQQWRQRCAAQSVGQGMANRAANISNPDDAAALDGLWIKPGDLDTGLKLRTDMVSVGGGGPLFPSITLEGRTWQPPPEMYDVLAAIRLLVIASCTVTAMFIVGRSI